MPRASANVLSIKTELISLARKSNLAVAATQDAEETAARSKSRPFIKWAGGKGRLLDQLTSRLPDSYQRYFEPFVGGGALFFHLEPAQATLSDTNAELINCYTVIRDNVDELILSLGQHRYEREYYYALRNIDRASEYASWTSIERASRLIYLNKTCYNGLYRVNSHGQFNVPFGRYDDPTIVDEENLRTCSEMLQDIELVVEPFTDVLNRADKGDFIYFDPPYVPLSQTASFTSYTQEGFALRDHFTLFKVCKELDARGAFFSLTNSYTTLALDLYRSFDIEIISANRAINSKSTGRGPQREVIVRNY